MKTFSKKVLKKPAAENSFTAGKGVDIQTAEKGNVCYSWKAREKNGENVTHYKRGQGLLFNRFPSQVAWILLRELKYPTKPKISERIKEGNTFKTSKSQKLKYQCSSLWLSSLTFSSSSSNASESKTSSSCNLSDSERRK